MLSPVMLAICVYSTTGDGLLEGPTPVQARHAQAHERRIGESRPRRFFARAPSPLSPFIDVALARTLTASAATVIDARGRSAKAPYIAGARIADWLSLRDGWLRTGRLTDNLDELRRYFEARGVRQDRPVLVYGAMDKGWGEEGRLWWTLHYLGHPRVYILDGGIHAWLAASGPTQSRPTPTRAADDAQHRFQVRLNRAARVGWRRVDALRKQPQTTILDVRTREEYDGKTPFWSSRGGHIPGARWLYWKSLIGTDGRLLSHDRLRAKFRAAGISAGHPVVTYCTGGVRSAFVAAALRQAGLTDVANYDGSWWDWSRRPTQVVRGRRPSDER